MVSSADKLFRTRSVVPDSEPDPVEIPETIGRQNMKPTRSHERRWATTARTAPCFVLVERADAHPGNRGDAVRRHGLYAVAF
jgi:hypothetical protein